MTVRAHCRRGGRGRSLRAGGASNAASTRPFYLRAPADGVVSVIVAEVGENIRAGQPVLVIAEAGKQFLSFNEREDLLHGLTVGTSVNVRRSGAAEKTSALVTELRPLGTFATWQAERAVGGTTAILCAYASICRVIRPALSRACRFGSSPDLRPAAVIGVHPLRRRLPLNGAAFNIR
ncbi:MAG: HlyD family efflux transporter periplasmic adaptor subunit [Pseudolabrys sp.]